MFQITHKNVRILQLTKEIFLAVESWFDVKVEKDREKIALHVAITGLVKVFINMAALAKYNNRCVVLFGHGLDSVWSSISNSF